MNRNCQYSPYIKKKEVPDLQSKEKQTHLALLNNSTQLLCVLSFFVYITSLHYKSTKPLNWPFEIHTQNKNCFVIPE